MAPPRPGKLKTQAQKSKSQKHRKSQNPVSSSYAVTVTITTALIALVLGLYYMKKGEQQNNITEPPQSTSKLHTMSAKREEKNKKAFLDFKLLPRRDGVKVCS